MAQITDQQVEEQIQWVERMYPPTRFPRPKPKMQAAVRSEAQNASKVKLEAEFEAQKKRLIGIGSDLVALRNDMAATLYTLNRDPALYGEWRTWERYCAGHLNISRSWSYELIEKHRQKVENEKDKLSMSGTGQCTDSVRYTPSYAEIKVLAKSSLPVAAKQEALKAARSAPGKSKVKALRVEIKKREAAKKLPAPPTPEPEKPVGLDLHALAEPFRGLRKQIDDLSRAISALANEDVGRWLRSEPDKPELGIRNQLREAIKILRVFVGKAAPFGECSCGGKKGCRACAGMGWATEGVLA